MTCAPELFVLYLVLIVVVFWFCAWRETRHKNAVDTIRINRHHSFIHHPTGEPAMTITLPEGFAFTTRTEDSGKSCVTEIFPTGGQFATTGHGPILKIVTKRYSSGPGTFMRKCTISGTESGIAWEKWAYGDFSKSIPHPEVKRLTAKTCHAAHMAVLSDTVALEAVLREVFGA